ncbi:SGNH/GDSL hydrolase family protein [Streptomyces spectabilis]|uniref:SGNH/GDSL hydrolase family protein n=1 Tax=Streptomyces spectabilis TaxID=68270 RepID=A0A516RAL9_STRST|nr:SGNH/GDSL hydrolase family protein [Streptomyces spectabilis]QDQ12696.1 SGNH/GDSL hydrolase family protein [Streptomyces spectabilis]
MRKQLVGGALAGMLLLGACGDPGEDDAAPRPPAAARTDASQPPSQTNRQQAERDRQAERDQHPEKNGRKPDRRKPAGPGPAPRVLYLGDSLAMENQDVLGTLLRDRLAARYTSAPYSGTTLCDYLEGTGEDSLVPDRDKAAKLVRELRPDVVVLQFWGNAWGYTPCMGGVTYDKQRDTYFARYAADARRLTRQIEEAARDAGAPRPKVVWVSQGPDAMTPDRVRRVNELYRRQAAASGDLVSDAGRAVGPASARYRWVRELPCTAYERSHPAYCTEPGGRTALHRGDDFLHFCLAPTTPKSRPCPVRSPGIRRIGQAVTDTVAAAARR